MTLPAHTPDRDQLLMTYGEPDDMAADGPMTNLRRVVNAHNALSAYLPLVVTGPGVTLEPLSEPWENGEADGILSDLISDLLHLACYTGLDPEETIRKGLRDFTAEVGMGYEQ